MEKYNFLPFLAFPKNSISAKYLIGAVNSIHVVIVVSNNTGLWNILGTPLAMSLCFPIDILLDICIFNGAYYRNYLVVHPL